MAISPTNPSQHISCLKVEGRPKHDAYVLIVTTDEDRNAYESRIFYYPEFPNREGSVMLSQPTWLVDFTVAETGDIHAISADGRIWSAANGEIGDVKVSSAGLTKICGPLETNTIAAAGSDGDVFLLDHGQWRSIRSPFAARLIDITAISASDIYVCGADGVFGHWNGSSWTVIDLGTNVDLLCVAHDEKGRVLVGGQNGLAFIGTATSGFEAVPGAEHGLYGICPYEGGFLLAAVGMGFYFCDGTTLTPFKEGLAPYRVSAVGKIIFAAADGDVLLYTGREWLQLPVY